MKYKEFDSLACGECRVSHFVPHAFSLQPEVIEFVVWPSWVRCWLFPQKVRIFLLRYRWFTILCKFQYVTQWFNSFIGYTPFKVQFSSVAQSYLTLCDPMDCSTPGLSVHHQLPEFIQTQVHWVSDAIQPSHPLSSPSPPAFSLSQHQGLFKWVSSLHQLAKVLELQL